jgi:hypothetical protein
MVGNINSDDEGKTPSFNVPEQYRVKPKPAVVRNPARSAWRAKKAAGTARKAPIRVAQVAPKYPQIDYTPSSRRRRG